MREEKRSYQRTKTTLLTRFTQELSAESRPDFQEGVVVNFSRGGMYIATDCPSAKGSILLIKFRIHSQTTDPMLPFEVRSTVRWTRYLSNPKGMGVEFLEFHGIDEHDFHAWITNLLR